MVYQDTNAGAFVTVGVDTSKFYDNDKTFRKKSIYRAWRQLTSTQKLTWGLSILAFLLFVYIFALKTKVYVKDIEANFRHEPHPIGNPLSNKFDREKYMEKVHAELHEKIKPLKRGPPKRSQKKSSESPNIKQQHSIVDEITDNDNTIENNNGRSELDLYVENSVKNIKKLKPDAGVRVLKPAGTSDFRERLLDHDGKELQAVKEEFDGDYARFPEHIPTNEKQQAVVDACRHAWKGYKEFAWGQDELVPIAGHGHEWFHLGLTIVDSLDTLWLMNLKEEYKEARDWVETSLSFNKPVMVNLFETTIRILGGLLSIYHLTSDHMYLEKAADLGDRLMGAFKSNSKIPYADVSLRDKSGRPPGWGPDSSLSEVTTIQLEFKDLSYSLNNPQFQAAADNVMLQIFSLDRTHGLAPIYINADSGKFRPGATITLGARGDSYYEYLLKQWIQSGKKDEQMKQEYLKAMEGVKKLLVRKSEPNKLTYVGELLNGRSFSPKMDHLVCFLAGTLALGNYHGLPEWHLDLGKELLETCYQMYARMETGLSPEIVFFNQMENAKEDLLVKPADAHNLLRPETVESLHVLYEITKDKKYQEYGWKIFQAFEKYTKVPHGGYVSINNVQSAENPRRGGNRDKMESFFVGETLKYLYLLFSDVTILPLDKFVFNTEAHPLPVFHT